MAIFREGTNPIWGAIVLLYVVCMLALDGYWLVTETGPVGAFARWQARNLFHGKYYPKLTVMLVLLAEIAILLVVKLLVERISGRKLTQPQTPK